MAQVSEKQRERRRMRRRLWHQREHPAMERDAHQQPVAYWLSKVFAVRRKLCWWNKQLGKMEEELTELIGSPGAKHLDLPGLTAQLRRMQETIARNVPYLRCNEPGCSAICPRCDGDRWVTARTMAGPITSG